MLQSNSDGGSSSVAERLTVAQDVVGSIPTRRPILKSINYEVYPSSVQWCDDFPKPPRGICMALQFYHRHRMKCEDGHAT
jgi:hypothetical protein